MGVMPAPAGLWDMALPAMYKPLEVTILWTNRRPNIFNDYEEQPLSRNM
jgi:hypothetical protein